MLIIVMVSSSLYYILTTYVRLCHIVITKQFNLLLGHLNNNLLFIIRRYVRRRL